MNLLDPLPNNDDCNEFSTMGEAQAKRTPFEMEGSPWSRHRSGKRPFRSRCGLGRVEVVLILFCLALLAALGTTGVYQRRLSAEANLCGARQYRVALAMQGYSRDFDLMPGFRNLQAMTEDQRPGYCSWVFPTLSFLEPLNRPLTIRSGEQTRVVRGDQAPSLASGEEIVFGQSSFQSLVDRYGPSGSAATRGLKPQLRIAELICPAASNLADSTNSMNWRVNTGLPDRPGYAMPPDWPANGVFLNSVEGDEFQSLKLIESRDGLSYTVLLSEGLESLQWTDTEEVELGIYWAFDRSWSKRDDKPVETRERGGELPTSVESVDPSNWSLLGIESAIGVFGSGWGARRPTSLHPNGVTVTFCSGATQTLARDIDPLTWAQMMMSFDQNARFPTTAVKIAPQLTSFKTEISISSK
ncbi:MAG: DUF1559 domain-containing protein [Planctomycetota bacterium]|nr:DUF1559 domain-containing protein [Planctomycetota bacterium]